MIQRHAINLSTAWEPPGDGSRAWVRRFGRPSGVKPGDRVWLVHEGGCGESLVFNGVHLGGRNARHDVTALLHDRNELLLTPAEGAAIKADAPQGGSSPALSHGRRPLDPRHGQFHLEIEHGLS